MSVITTCARTAAVVSFTAILATGAVIQAAASPRAPAIHPVAIAEAAAAANSAVAEQAKSSKARVRAERAVNESADLLDQAKRALAKARERLTQLDAAVADFAEHRRPGGVEMLDVAAEATQVAADVVLAGPVVGALDPLAEAIEEDPGEQQPMPDSQIARHNLRMARAKALRDHRAAADEVARAQQAAESRAEALTGATNREQQAAATARVATANADTLAASLGIDKRLVRPGVGTASSGYGMRTHPVTGARRAHTGVDFHFGDGRAYAAAEGTVVEVRVDPAYGNLVTIAHGEGIRTRYAHLAAAVIEPGDHVSAGHVVGKIGSTGLSTGPHLHFEIQVNGRLRDPADWLGG
jgi:murein DD-endopeptidase MepM/ murein hydrolase activator NlpD